MSEVYIIRAIGTATPIKIGVAASPNKRLRQLQTGSAVRLEVVQTFCAKNRHEAAAWEAAAHAMFADSRATGEWFDVTAEEVVRRSGEWMVAPSAPQRRLSISRTWFPPGSQFHPVIPDRLRNRPVSGMSRDERIEFWACFNLPEPPEGHDDWYIIGSPKIGVIGAIPVEGFVNGEPS